MSTPLPIMKDAEIERVGLADPEAGFGSLRTSLGALPLARMDVEAKIVGLVSEVTLRQTFVNALDEPLEATYIFPLPDRGAVTSFRMEVADRVIDGVLKERGEARRDYQEAIEAGHRAAITEEERPNVFTLRVGNLMPGEEASIQLGLTTPLPYSDGEATFRFPLVVAPRYVPGMPLDGESVGDGVALDTDAVPDASRISPPVLLPGFPNPVRLGITVNIDGQSMPIRDLRSSLHAVVETEKGETFRQVSVRPGERLNRDFILRFRLSDEAIRTSLVMTPDSAGDEGTFLLTMVPPAHSSTDRLPRDVVFVLDRSGSMGGWAMVAARRAMARMVDTLTDRDRFALYAFDNTIETPPDLAGTDLVDATDRNRFRAVEFLARLDARGGTEMARPLNEAASKLAGGYADRDRIVVLVTDGQVGNEDQILRSLSKRIKNVRIFTLGIDRAVNAGFLRRLAVLGGGACELVESEDRLDAVMDRIHRRIDTPVLTEVQVEPEGLELVYEQTVPDRIGDLFAGTPLTVMGRFRGKASGRLVVKAMDSSGAPFSQTVEGVETSNGAVGVVWARGMVRQLEDEYVVRGADPRELDAQILQTSLRFSVLSRFTAFVAVDRSEVVNPNNEGRPSGEGRRLTQPVEAPEGWAMFEQAPAKHMSMGPLGGAVPVAAAASAPPEPPFLEAETRSPLKTMGLSLRGSLDVQASSKGGHTHSGFIEGASDTLNKLLGRATRRARPKRGESLHGARENLNLDLAPYRRRAQALVERLESRRDNDDLSRKRALGELSVRLRTLVEDLTSVGGPRDTIASLSDLLTALKDVSSRADLGGAELDALWAETLRVLREFFEGTAATDAPPKRDKFWK